MIQLKNYFWSKKQKQTILKSWWKKTLTESLKNRHSEEKEPCKWNLTAKGWDTHKCCPCKVYKPDIFQINVTSIRWQKWVTETGHIITVTGQTQSCPCLQLLELYTQVPSLSRTHTHTHTQIHTLSMCCVFCSLTFQVVLLFVLNSFQTK